MLKCSLMLSTGLMLGLVAFAGESYAAGKDVALILGVKGSPFDDALACGAIDAAAKLGVKLTVFAPDHFTGESQAPVIDAVTARAPAITIISPADSQSVTRPLRQMHDRGTQIITVDTTIIDHSFVASEVITDNEQGGRVAADAINQALGGKGSVFVLTNPPGAAAQDARTRGFEEELKKYPGITDLGAQYQNDDPQKASEIITSMLAAHPDLGGIFATNDQGAIGASTGLKQAGAAARVKVVAYDSAAAEVSALKNGLISVLIAQDPKREGEVSVELAQKLLKGETIPKTALTDTVVIRSSEKEKAERYEYKSDCQLNY